MSRFAVLVLGGWLAVSLLADVIASDLPLLVHVNGTTSFFPCVVRPSALRGFTQQRLATEADWMVGTPVPYGPLQTSVTTRDEALGPPPLAPSRRHLLGTDDLGRDVVARLIHGARYTLLMALSVVLLSTVLGLFLGAVAGWKGGWWDFFVGRALEWATAFPTVFFLIIVVAALRESSPPAVVLVLGATRWTQTARLVRIEVARLSSMPFVVAARSLGASEGHVLFRHLIPNAMPAALVSATFGLGTAVLIESSLSFLGLGVIPPHPSWGDLLQAAQRTLVYPGAWWLAVVPGVAIASLVLATQSLGETLTRRFDLKP
jgi:peptide/nickel transport system permease protein